MCTSNRFLVCGTNRIEGQTLEVHTRNLFMCTSNRFLVCGTNRIEGQTLEVHTRNLLAVHTCLVYISSMCNEIDVHISSMCNEIERDLKCYWNFDFVAMKSFRILVLTTNSRFFFTIVAAK